MKVGMLGVGGIGKAVMPTVAKLSGMSCYAVASRSKERAEAFAKAYGFEKAYGSYEDLVKDPEVDLIYVATPHAHHFDAMMLSLSNGKSVLCEKSFTLNAAQAERIKAYANTNHIFAAEAIWPRYMPSRRLINDTIESGIIGKPHILTANLSYKIAQKQRIMDPALAGGALLDVGVYGINFALMHFGSEIEGIESAMQRTKTGVDGMETITLFYKDGRMAVLTHGIYARGDRKGIIYGEDGYIVVENINNPQGIFVFDDQDRLIKEVSVPKQINGYEYEFLECMQMLKEGKIETASMPLSDSVEMMRIMDRIRSDWGLIYPMEQADRA